MKPAAPDTTSNHFMRLLKNSPHNGAWARAKLEFLRVGRAPGPVRLVSLLLVSLAAFAGTATQLLPKAPVRFEPNVGQIHSGKGAILWAARGPGYAIAFTREATLFKVGSGTISLRLLGQNQAADFAASSPLPVSTNYFTPGYRGAVRNYGRLRRNQIYPGIDLVYYGDGDRLEYDFEIAPGADPSRIRMRFAGARSLRLSSGGDLLLDLGGDVITQHVPVVYQKKASGERVRVPAAYRLAANRDVTVALSRYDATAPLVIDPVISFAAYASGSGSDAGVAIAHDRQGFVYLAGNTSSTDFVTANGAYTSNAGSQDIWLIKLNPAATSADQVVVYSSLFGGALIDSLKAMTIDSNGWVYLTGSTTSTDLPITDRAFQSTNAGGTDGFVAVFDPSQSGRLSLLYATYLGGAGFDEPAGIAVAKNKIYVTGSTLSDNFPLAHAFQPGRNVGRDAFLTEIDIFQSGSASLVASTYFGGSKSDFGRTVAVDAAGNVYIAGFTDSADLPVSANAYQSTYGGGGDAFLTQFDFTLQGSYSTYLGGSGADEARKIVIDPAGRVALTGYTSSADFVITQSAAQPLLGGTGATNAFLALIDPKAPAAKALVYSTYFGGSVAEVANDLQLDAKGSYYIGGYSMSPDLPVSQNALSPVSARGGLNGFVAVINPSAPPNSALRYASYITGPGSQTVNGVDAGANGAIYVTGWASGDIFPSANPPHSSLRGNTDAFVLVFTP